MLFSEIDLAVSSKFEQQLLDSQWVSFHAQSHRVQVFKCSPAISWYFSSVCRVIFNRTLPLLIQRIQSAIASSAIIFVSNVSGKLSTATQSNFKMSTLSYQCMQDVLDVSKVYSSLILIENAGCKIISYCWWLSENEKKGYKVQLVNLGAYKLGAIGEVRKNLF